MTLPTFEESTGTYRLTWEEEHLKIAVSRIRQHNDGRVVGEITITTNAPGYNPLLHRAQFNFTSSRSRADLAKMMEKRYSEADWDNTLEQLSYYILDRVRRGEPVKEIRTTDDIKPPDYLLWPIIPLNQPTVIFGDGGVGKSYLALVFALCIELPWEDNPFGLVTKSEPTRTLLLDYETDESEVAWRLKCLKQGMSLPDLSLNYRRCALPLVDDLEQIQESVSSTGADFVIVDSIGAACGSDLNAAETAIRLFGALRQLKKTSLLISHTSKDQITKTKTIFGSAYFHNFARSIWEMKKVQEMEESIVSIGLFHKKSNLSKLYHPIGFKMTFGENEVAVESEDVRTVAEFLEVLSNSARIEELLKSGPMVLPEIAKELDLNKEVARATLNRMKAKGKSTKVGDKWGLAAKDYP